MDAGLLAGLGEGLKQGLSTYNLAKQYNDQKEEKKKQYNLELFKAHAQEDPNNPGGLIQNQSQIQSNAPFISAARQGMVDNYKELHPKATDEEINQRIPLSGTMDQYKNLSTVSQKPAASVVLGLGKNAALEQRNTNTQTGQGLSFGEKAMNDPIIVAANNQNTQITKTRGAINDKTVPPQAQKEAALGLARAISGTSSPTESTIHGVEFTNAKTGIASMLQKIDSGVASVDDPQVLKYLDDRFAQIQDINSKAAQEQNKKYIELGGSVGGNPALKRVTGLLKTRQNAPAGILPSDVPKPVDAKDQEAIDWAKKNPKDQRAQQILKMHGM